MKFKLLLYCIPFLVFSFKIQSVDRKENERKPLKDQMQQDSLMVDEHLFDKKHWQYFGWEEDHPKAISLMGGAVYPRRPRLMQMDDHSWEYSKEPWHSNSSDLVCFLLSVDGSEPWYPNENSPERRTNIQWSLAENYLSAPTSGWEKDKIKIDILHFGRRILDNKVNAVYTRITLKNTDSLPHNATLSINGNFVQERVFPLKSIALKAINPHVLEISKALKPGETCTFNFVLPANGQGKIKDIIAEGSLEENFAQMKSEIDNVLDTLTQPISLPNDELIDHWKASMVNMWVATVETPEDYEQRGSGGNVKGYYQYDRTFDHDVPDMVIQYILEGRSDLAKNIMEGACFDRLSKGILAKERYLDAVPKYLITMAQYLMTTGDRSYFTDKRLATIKTSAKGIHGLRIKQLDPALKGKGPYGLIDESFTLDNKINHLVVDNFAALHGLAAYKYLNEQFSNPEEAKWAEEEMKDLNSCLNDALDISMEKSNVNWYNAVFSFSYDSTLVSGPGNWFGTTLMMPTFPWNAYLKGFNLGGTWKDHFDNSIAKLIEQSLDFGNPEGSLGAWWSAKYGAIYNAGMAMSFLYSEHYRSTVVDYIEWMLDNQSVPYHWGESFYEAAHPGDWTIPATDLETWGLGFNRQALLQVCVSNHIDGTVIIGRGIPDRWLNTEKEIAWENVRINSGKSIDLSIFKKGNELHITIYGDNPDGALLIDIPIMVNNIESIETDGKILDKDYKNGKVWFSQDTRSINIKLKQ
jgi:hypothetical protein